jgi:hypothetical protein
LNSRARAASTTADSSHNCAKLIMIMITRRAVQTAVRPLGCG